MGLSLFRSEGHLCARGGIQWQQQVRTSIHSIFAGCGL